MGRIDRMECEEIVIVGNVNWMWRVRRSETRDLINWF